jgi:hypothetical protein
MKPRNFLILLYLFLSCRIVFAQEELKPAYIILNQFDTIKGVGNMSKNQEYCWFKKLGADDITTYLPNEIDAFRIVGGKYFVSRKIEETDRKLVFQKWYFLEFLVDGEINLFTIQHSIRFFIEKEDKGLVELIDETKNLKNRSGISYSVKNNKYIGYLKLYLSEAPELSPRIEQMDYLNQRDLVKLSVDYHNAVCNKYECINYTKNLPNVKYKLEVLSGITRYNSFYSPQIGVLVHIGCPFINENLFVITGIIYSERPYYLRQIYNIGSNPDLTEHEYRIKLPFSLQYVFGKKHFKPTIAFGLPAGIPITSVQGGFIYSITNRFEISCSGSIDGLFHTAYYSAEETFNNKLGHSLNFGLMYQIK